MTLGPVSSREIHLLTKEVEAQGELLAQERLERIADTDRLEIELEAIRATLTRLMPDFAATYERVRAENIPLTKTPPKIRSG